ncbi:if [Bugula neritina]|uniref:If n=1 Tax=Bugula neritina TaxID=10212 RepID=A0A7J7JCC1_BUGNE|nr:if [Bugula neritina]
MRSHFIWQLLPQLVAVCTGFLLDTDSVRIFSDLEGRLSEQTTTMFGYSVSFLNDTLLVGAPKVNASRFDDIIEPGGVYSCSLSDSGSADGCSLLQIDDSPNNIATIDFDFDPIENKTRQWLGATLSTEPNSGFVLTCAPRYIYKSKKGNKVEPTGKCYYGSILKTGSQFTEVSPCKDEYKLSTRSTFCTH